MEKPATMRKRLMPTWPSSTSQVRTAHAGESLRGRWQHARIPPHEAGGEFPNQQEGSHADRARMAMDRRGHVRAPDSTGIHGIRRRSSRESDIEIARPRRPIVTMPTIVTSVR